MKKQVVNSDVKKGDIAYFKCGGKVKILGIAPSSRFLSCYYIKFHPHRVYGAHYNDAGHLAAYEGSGASCKTCFSIVKITRPRRKR